MAFFLGNHGTIRLRRGSDLILGNITASVGPDDINTSLNRVGFDKAAENLVTGDRIIFSTTDSRGLDFIPGASDDYSAFVNVNAVGGLRLFDTFARAINNERANELTLENFTGDPLEVNLNIRDTRYNVLGNVTSYEFNTSRDSIDVTALDDKYKQQFNAGLLSGSGRIECMFDYTTDTVNEPPIVMLQTIQRLDLGCDFDIALYLTDDIVDPSVTSCFYQTTAVTTSTGITVEAGGIVNCTIDFVTTGEIRLIIGRPQDYILQEDDDRIQMEHTLDYLLQEVTD